jgi:hypothetical protein
MFHPASFFSKMSLKGESRKAVSLAKIVGIFAVLALSAFMSLSFAYISPVHATGPCTLVVTSTENGGSSFTTAATDQTSGTIDATGCDIGDYIDKGLAVSSITIHDANQFGIFVDSGCLVSIGCVPGTSFTVTISGANVFDIGNHGPIGVSCASLATFCPNGVQTGIGILYDSSDGAAPHLGEPLVKGSIDSSTIYNYQKGGIVIKHNANVNTTNDAITGLGQVNFIAQNGIEYAYDTATGVIRGNTVSGNFYTGSQGLLADGSPCGPGHPTPICPPGRLYIATGILLVFVDPNNIHRGQNNVPGPGSPNGNEHPYAVVTDAPLD